MKRDDQVQQLSLLGEAPGPEAKQQPEAPEPAPSGFTSRAEERRMLWQLSGKYAIAKPAIREWVKELAQERGETRAETMTYMMGLSSRTAKRKAREWSVKYA
jgi:hypothetical protein